MKYFVILMGLVVTADVCASSAAQDTQQASSSQLAPNPTIKVRMHKRGDPLKNLFPLLYFREDEWKDVQVDIRQKTKKVVMRGIDLECGRRQTQLRLIGNSICISSDNSKMGFRYPRVTLEQKAVS
jgi:hypothetical protein